MTFPEKTPPQKRELTSDELQKRKTTLLEKVKFFTYLKEEIASCPSEEDLLVLEKKVADALGQLQLINEKTTTLATNIQSLL